MRRLKAYDSLMGGDPPGGSWYNRLPDTEIHEDNSENNYLEEVEETVAELADIIEELRNKPSSMEGIIEKLENLRSNVVNFDEFKNNLSSKEKQQQIKKDKHQSEQEATNALGKNPKLNQRSTGNAGDSENKISNTLPMGMSSLTDLGKSYYNGNTDPNRASQWHQYVASNKLNKRYASKYQELANKWTNIIENPSDPTAFIYMQLAYLFQEIMYDITELVVHKQQPSEPVVIFVHDWLNNNPIARQCIRYCGNDFTESNTYVGLVRGLYNLREMLSSIQEYDHSSNIRLRNQRTFY